MVDINTRLQTVGPMGHAIDVSLKEIIDAATSAIRTELGLGALATKNTVANTDLAGGAAKVTVAAGAAAGDVTVTGITTADELVSVLYFTKSTNITAITDLTGEFTVAAGKINNTGGTASTDGYLVVIWNKLH